MLIRSSAQPETNSVPVVQRACDCGGPCAECVGEERLGGSNGVKLGPRNDPFEREADRVADAVMSGDTLQRKPMEEQQDMMQRQTEEEEEEETLQAKTAGAGPRTQSGVPAAEAAVANGGRPLPLSERAFFEPRFGRDLSHVRIHTDAEAARSIAARAYTLRNHIAFAPGQFSPGSREGRRLMAHELTHTLQQGFAGAVRRVPYGTAFDDDEDFGRSRDPLAPPHMGDPRGPGASTLTYAQSRELSRCIRVMGSDAWAEAQCANTVLGTPIPEWLRVQGVSTPVPSTARPRAGSGATMRIGRVTLTILPDTRTSDPALQDKAKTEIIPEPLPDGANLVSASTMNGLVTSFTVHSAAFRLSIRTTYGPGVNASSTSGYGRGTTALDQSSGSTSLGFHEGEHGRDFITFLRNNAYPQFRGTNGQTEAVFVARINQFETALQDYINRMNRASELATDCSGTTTIDDFNATNGSATTICQPQPGNP
jgi:hypothetical protein